MRGSLIFGSVTTLTTKPQPNLSSSLAPFLLCQFPKFDGGFDSNGPVARLDGSCYSDWTLHYKRHLKLASFEAAAPTFLLFNNARVCLGVYRICTHIQIRDILQALIISPTIKVVPRIFPCSFKNLQSTSSPHEPEENIFDFTSPCGQINEQRMGRTAK